MFSTYTFQDVAVQNGVRGASEVSTNFGSQRPMSRNKLRIARIDASQQHAARNNTRIANEHEVPLVKTHYVGSDLLLQLG